MPDAQDRTLRDTELGSEAATAPTLSVGRGLVQRLGENSLDELIADGARRPRARLIKKAGHTIGNETLSPFADGLRGYTQAPRDLAIRESLVALQNDAGPERQRDAALAARPSAQLTLLLGAESDWLQTRATMHRQFSVSSPERKLPFDRVLCNWFKELLTQRVSTAVP